MVVRTEIQTEILEAALSELEEGIAVLDAESRVLFWNPAAIEITGHLRAELLSSSLPVGFYRIETHPHAAATYSVQANRPLLVHMRHRQGHSLPAMLRRTPLRDATGKCFGTLLRFHPVEGIDALPHGASDSNGGHENRLEQSQGEMQDRINEAWQEWATSGVPLGLLWITVDQAAALRRTHGRDALEAMLGTIERTLVHGLRAAEILGRWGTNEFLVLSHERTAEMLESHARRVGALAQTADFRWWGDRVPLSVSIGAAQAAEAESLLCLLKRVQRAVQQSVSAGGNRVTGDSSGTEGLECSQS